VLEYVPAWLGELLRNRRAGHEKLVAADPALSVPDARFELSSPAFAAGARLPLRFTADGEGVSPPLLWSEVPEGTASLALIVEDPDAPAASPLVHAIVWNIPATERRLGEGVIVPDGEGGPMGDVGRNSFLQEGWLPPDPPTGHGEHDYVFQLFALSEPVPLDANPGRSAFVRAIAGKVLGVAVLIGTYSRGDDAQIGSAAALQPGVAPA
jgi:Raf kinase inhibitor-like YbhB/YbcL family protein